ncbi:hypothetical protein BJ878DRAFT_489169 [Calycina marina]|uniref:Uncharacterized protein n=1 Tax=Calycina marina TaxID=1763456 RepID=A0A9P7ZAI6_9HELO|nr:hypothetical protein BJ878DRAFT_489169 [Calycina marina]
MVHFMHLRSQIWQKEWHTYQNPRARIDLWSDIWSEFFTPARIGEYCRPESGMEMYCRDIVFGLFLNENGDPKFAIRIANATKNISEKADKGFGNP